MTLTQTEENYLKAIYLLSSGNTCRIANQAIAAQLSNNPATVTEMLRRLNDKKLISYSRAEGASLTEAGLSFALQIVRKHRLWETFLVQALGFTWDEVHDVAEQLEHVQSAKLLEQLDRFLGYPQFDPHGDPIPGHDGRFPALKVIPLTAGAVGISYSLAAVTQHSSSFLQYLDKLGLAINDRILVRDIQSFDLSMSVCINDHDTAVFLSHEVCKNLLVAEMQ